MQNAKVKPDQAALAPASAILTLSDLYFALLLFLAALGCINGAPLPPMPASSRTFQPVRPDGELQEGQCIQIAQTYVRGLGKDPTLATYEVHRKAELDDEEDSDETPTVAVIDVNFIDGTRWRLALKRDGSLNLLAN
ncbi:MAG: hypothetical protein ACREHD_04805 [Pirellulales bacterium]